MNDTATVHLGPRNAESGLEVTIVNCYLSEDDVNDAEYTVLTHVCHGVEDIDVQDPWQMGTLEPASMIRLTFTTGRVENISGVITDVETEHDN